MAEAESDTEATEPPKIVAEEYPCTVQVREEQFTWHFAKVASADDMDAVEFSHIEIRGHDYAPIKRFPWSLPDDIRNAVEAEGYTVIG
jgi:hypothetical protein